jgi:hypothetical protein
MNDGGGGPRGTPPRLPAAALAAGAVGATVALLAMAAAGSHASPFGPARTGRNQADVLVVLSLVILGGMLLFGLIMVVLAILWREHVELPKRSGWGNWSWFALLLVIVLVYWRRPQLGNLPSLFGPGTQVASPAGGDDAVAPGPPTSGWLPIAALATALVAAVAASALAERRRRRRTPPARSEAELLAELVEKALLDLAGETDPRRAVIVAYAVMERGLAAAGLPRGIGETPLEHTTRALLDAHVPAAPVATLAALFERARFSHHPIDEAMRAEALAALGMVRAARRARAAAVAAATAERGPA